MSEVRETPQSTDGPQCDLLAEVVTLRQRGTMVIPAAMRRALGVEEGANLLLLLEDGELRVRPVPEDPIERLASAITEAYGDVRPELALRELREEWPD